eukprot:11372078-Alexandrium_andersonii.AAC.1
MSASLVGSEMCIRDRARGYLLGKFPQVGRALAWAEKQLEPIAEAKQRDAVSYTHLTLPTICSV